MTTPDALAAALQAHAAGFCVVPPREDGTKHPIGQWKRYQQQRPGSDLIHGWYEMEGRRGVGLICGAVSGNLEMLEFEGKAVEAGLHKRFRELAEAAGLGSVLSRINGGYTERTPSGGLHLLYRCEAAVEGNLKLARRPATPEELAVAPQDKIKVLIETRGEGGYVITAPSNGGVHPLGGAWVLVAGGFDSVATISAAEREALLDLARSLDEMPREPAREPAGGGKTGERPGDDFNVRANWADILMGWTPLFTAADGNQHWRRPGKSIGTSATISEGGQGLLYVFTSSTEFDSQRAYSRFGAYAVLHHAGDHRAAAAELRRQGYGAQAAPGEARRDVSGEAQDVSQAETVVRVVSPLQTASPDTAQDDVFHGLVGRLTTLITPYVESNEMSVLAQFLVAFGVAVGTKPHFMVGATRHAPVLYLGLVGQTSRARKGTSWDPIESLFRRADPGFATRMISGVGSGERLVYLVRDPRYEEDKEGNSKLVDPGVQDRRLLLQEPELARLLTVVNREGSTMSAYLRSAYDGKPLRNEVKTGGSAASTHHIGLVGHCTTDDLTGQLREQEVRNGLANRIMWVTARRDKRLADPPIFEGIEVQEAATELQLALDRAKRVGTMRRHAAAQELWNEWYLGLPDDGAGIVDALTNRRESLVIRASMVYALTDGAQIIGLDHLRAALALEAFVMRCVQHIFGGSTGHAVADRILEELQAGPLFKAEIYDLFNRNLSADRLLEAQRVLERRGLLVRERVSMGGPGRPKERWRRP